jgi:hypothetical protein
LFQRWPVAMAAPVLIAAGRAASVSRPSRMTWTNRASLSARWIRHIRFR